MSWDRHVNRSIRRAGVVLGVAAAAAQLAGAARADAVCTYDASTHTVSASVSPEFASVIMAGDASVDGVGITLQAVTSDGNFANLACGGATMLNTDRIVAQGSGGSQGF